VLMVVKDVNFPTYGLRSDNIHALRHVPRFVDFALMINLNFNLDLLMLRYGHTSLGSQVSWCAYWSPRGLWLILDILRRLLRDLHCQDLNVVLLIIASVSANQ
jgi:hypothetical protein